MIEKIILTALSVPHGDPNNSKTKMGLPVVLWGDPGIGKSETVENVAEFLNFKLATIFPSTCAPEDFSGIPIGDGPGKVKRACAMEEVRDLCDIGEGILFIDESTTVGSTVQAALMGVVLNRRMGDVTFPPHVRPILAANPPETAAGGHDLTTTLANRCCHINYMKPTVSEWQDWNYDHEKGRKDLSSMFDAEKKVKEAWSSVWPQARSLVCGFMQSMGSTMLYSLPEEGHPSRTRAWPSHRTWFYAESALATCMALGMGTDIENKLIEGCVGEGAILAFSAWRRDANLPKPEDMLTNGWTPDRQRLDRSFYAYSALTGHVASLTDDVARMKAAGKAYQILREGCDAGLADLIYRPAVELINAKLLPSIMSGEGRKAGLSVLARFKDKSEALKKMAEAQ